MLSIQGDTKIIIISPSNLSLLYYWNFQVNNFPIYSINFCHIFYSSKNDEDPENRIVLVKIGNYLILMFIMVDYSRLSTLLYQCRRFKQYIWNISATMKNDWKTEMMTQYIWATKIHDINFKSRNDWIIKFSFFRKRHIFKSKFSDKYLILSGLA